MGLTGCFKLSLMIWGGFLIDFWFGFGFRNLGVEVCSFVALGFGRYGYGTLRRFGDFRFTV